jgi:hypothetical protein
MKFDVIGRINNMSLPDGKTAILYSVYEAVSNSIHAINDRFSEDRAAELGRVDVQIDVDSESEIERITIIDNGIGFTEENLSSFETSDSRYKYKRGGKGVGRFVWIKMFEDISVDSIVKTDSGFERRQFRFDPEKEDSICDLNVTEISNGEPGAKITLGSLRKEHHGRIRPSSYLKDLALHFFPQYISGTLPDVTITYRGEVTRLNDFIAEQVDEPVTEDVEADFGEGGSTLSITHLFVEASISTGLRNSYLLTAHGRLVGDPVSIERKYALKELPDGKAYVAVVRGDFLDARVDQERLDFKLTNSQKNTLEDVVLESAERFLADHISRVRARQRATVERLTSEHPQLSTQFTDIDEYVKGLSPGMDEEQIGQNLFVLLYRDERQIRDRIDQLGRLESLEPEARSQAEEMLEEISNQEKHRLAELVVKRHQLLQMANLLVMYKDDADQSHHYEKLIHDLICPMGEMYTSGELSRHNLWMLDDSLAAYEFFASDKSLASITEDSDSGKEPDIVFFNPLGFRREGTTDPVAIVEFKRPGDKRLSQDPVKQVLGYIDELRGSKVKDVNGEFVSDVGDHTPFECIIVCDLSDSVRAAFERSLAQTPMPDGMGYYGWSRTHNASIRVLSFKKVLRDAELRNRAFFEMLKFGKSVNSSEEESCSQKN